jgi:aminopeptidase
MLPKSKKRRAIEHLFRYLDARPGRLLFAYEATYQPIANEAILFARETGLDVDFLPVDECKPSDLFNHLTSAEKFLCAYNTTYGTGMSGNALIMTERATTLSLRAYTLADLSAAFFDVFQSCPDRIKSLNERLIRTLQHGRALTIRDPNGTHLEIQLDAAYDWVNLDGFNEAAFDLTCNLPIGEVATYSPSVNGLIRFSGALLGTIPIGRKYGAIHHPIVLEINNNCVTHVEAQNKQLQRDLEFCLFFDFYTNHVNEVGIGTNYVIRGPMTGLNYKYEENHYGFHLGFGASLAQQNVTRRTPHHLDLIFESATIALDGPILFDGDFRFEEFPESQSDSPLRLAARTCCGMLANISGESCA